MRDGGPGKDWQQKYIFADGHLRGPRKWLLWKIDFC